jgi:pyridoxine/pyridoxamine 5'-phosphate oxidase
MLSPDIRERLVRNQDFQQFLGWLEEAEQDNIDDMVSCTNTEDLVRMQGRTQVLRTLLKEFETGLTKEFSQNSHPG